MGLEPYPWSAMGYHFELIGAIEASVLDWFDAHSGAVTALATVVLVLITIAYVVVTYMLVREQRLQGDTPEIVHSVAGASSSKADLKIHNVGTGTAVELKVLAGPGEGIEVSAPELGWPRALLTGEDRIWPIRPIAGHSKFPVGDLPLTMRYFDTGKRRVFYRVMMIRVTVVNGQLALIDSGAVNNRWTKWNVLSQTLRLMKVWSWPQFLWRLRGHGLTILLLQDEVRRAVRRVLTEDIDNLREWSERAASARDRI